ncbi:MAG TPA: c-type cytochrome [Bryobacteraceae bacterium]|nr:c-type cytochrome [Bryobacteraceae bacterium]
MQKILMFSLAAVGIFLAGYGLVPGQQQQSQRDQQLSPETVRLIGSIDGPELYKAYCAVCHGNRGHGDGPMAAALKRPPSDLTRIAAHNSGAYPLGRVEKIIAGEEELGVEHGTAAMPIWGPIFSQVAWDQDLGHIRMHNLAEYIGRMQGR